MGSHSSVEVRAVGSRGVCAADLGTGVRLLKVARERRRRGRLTPRARLGFLGEVNFPQSSFVFYAKTFLLMVLLKVARKTSNSSPKTRRPKPRRTPTTANPPAAVAARKRVSDVSCEQASERATKIPHLGRLHPSPYLQFILTLRDKSSRKDLCTDADPGSHDNENAAALLGDSNSGSCYSRDFDHDDNDENAAGEEGDFSGAYVPPRGLELFAQEARVGAGDGERFAAPGFGHDLGQGQGHGQGHDHGQGSGKWFAGFKAKTKKGSAVSNGGQKTAQAVGAEDTGLPPRILLSSSSTGMGTDRRVVVTHPGDEPHPGTRVVFAERLGRIA